MNLQVLVSTMHQSDCKLLDKMNIQSDSIIINQCDKNKVDEFQYNGNYIKFMSFNERGVGLSRNNALMRASADICLMADDDMKYVDGYKDLVLKTFKKNPKADMIIFNVPIYRKNGKIDVKVKKNGRVRIFNCMKYGTVNIAFKRNIIIKKNINFSLLFGGGALYGSGEDSLFIINALKKGLKVYSSTEVIAEIKETGSTWFSGYNEKYFFDRGALFQAIGGNIFSLLLMIQFILRKKKLFSKELSPLNALNHMMNGRKNFITRSF